MFGGRGFVPVGYTALAFAVGVAFGLILRRTVPAMAATLGVMVVVQAVRAPVRACPPHPAGAAGCCVRHGEHPGLLPEPGRGSGHVLVPAAPGAWVLTNQTQAADGVPFTGPAHAVACAIGAPRGSCLEWIGTLDLRSVVTYQPASRFWDLQLVETGLLLLLAGLVLAWCFWKRCGWCEPWRRSYPGGYIPVPGARNAAGLQSSDVSSVGPASSVGSSRRLGRVVGIV